jgi:membrane protein implicated in regulation of membrane protease activity
MTALTHFLHFWYDFLVGDNWMMAAGVVPALAVSAGLACRDWHAWWVLPVAAVVLLTAPLWRATRRSDERQAPTQGTSGTAAGGTPTAAMPMDQTGCSREELYTQRRG